MTFRYNCYLLLLHFKPNIYKSVYFKFCKRIQPLISSIKNIKKIKMPILQINTNLSKSIIPLDFNVQICELMAEIFNVPLKFCVVHINTDQEIYWYGIEGPCILGTLKIIGGSGKIGPEQNIGHAEKLVKIISDNFKLPNKNISISFVELEAANVTTLDTTVLNYLQTINN